MTEGTKIVNLLAFGISGAIAVVIGIVNLWLAKKDRDALVALQTAGRLTQADLDRLTKPAWIWISNIVLIVLGLGLIIYGFFQFFSLTDKVVAEISRKYPELRDRVSSYVRPKVPYEAYVDRPASPSVIPSPYRVGSTSYRGGV